MNTRRSKRRDEVEKTKPSKTSINSVAPEKNISKQTKRKKNFRDTLEENNVENDEMIASLKQKCCDHKEMHDQQNQELIDQLKKIETVKNSLQTENQNKENSVKELQQKLVDEKRRTDQDFTELSSQLKEMTREKDELVKKMVELKLNQEMRKNQELKRIDVQKILEFSQTQKLLKQKDQKIKELTEQKVIKEHEVKRHQINQNQEINRLRQMQIEKHQEMTLLKQAQTLKNQKIEKFKKFETEMTQSVECPVCFEVPLSGPIPMCPNGHHVCSSCKRSHCPTCRVAMGDITSLLAKTVIQHIDHECRCCNIKLPLQELLKHKSICPQRLVACPCTCKTQVPFMKMIDHIISCTEIRTKQLESPEKGKPIHLGENLLGKRNTWQIEHFIFDRKVFLLSMSTKNGNMEVQIIGMGLKEEMKRYLVDISVLNEGSEIGFRSTTTPKAIGSVKELQSNLTIKETNIADMFDRVLSGKEYLYKMRVSAQMRLLK